MILRLLSVSIFITFLAVIINYLVYEFLPLYSKETSAKEGVTLFTNEKLSQFNGETKEELYLAILGEVYDVSKGRKHYGPGESYHAFIGRDASQSFVTGDFNVNNLSDDISKLSGQELLSLQKWKEFYDKQYEKKGVLIGRYYDSNGKKTDYYRKVEKWIEQAKSEERQKENIDKLFPPCNMEWTEETGTRVWCTEKSGGIQRDWIGFPVKYFEPGSDTYRCVCVKTYEDSGSISHYEDCYEKTSCYVKEEDDQ